MTIYFVLVLFLNLWLWKIISINLLIGLLVITASILRGKKGAFLLLILLVIQLKTTNIVPLTKLTENEIVIQIQRMREYDNPRIAHIIEERPESIIFTKLERNFSIVIDPSFYFFANHPRERAGIAEFEKFPYILLPFFIYGFYKLVKKKRYLFILLFLFVPLTLISIIGLDNPMGPFSLFPFIIITSNEGIIKKPFFVLIYLLVFLQTLAYALY